LPNCDNDATATFKQIHWVQTLVRPPAILVQIARLALAAASRRGAGLEVRAGDVLLFSSPGFLGNLSVQAQASSSSFWGSFCGSGL
jgi:hypothetical protein